MKKRGGEVTERRRRSDNHPTKAHNQQRQRPSHEHQNPREHSTQGVFDLGPNQITAYINSQSNHANLTVTVLNQVPTHPGGGLPLHVWAQSIPSLGPLSNQILVTVWAHSQHPIRARLLHRAHTQGVCYAVTCVGPINSIPGPLVQSDFGNRLGPPIRAQFWRRARLAR